MAGDFLSRSTDIENAKNVISECKAKKGVFAILGNHDCWTDPENLAIAINEAGIENISGRWVEIKMENVPEGLFIGGCEHPWGKKLRADSRIKDKALKLNVSHTPDNIYRLKETGAAAVFSGHFHGGQIRLPFAGAIVIPSIYGRRFDHGHFKIDNTHLFVSAGVGISTFGFRFYSNPDIFIIDIAAKK